MTAQGKLENKEQWDEALGMLEAACGNPSASSATTTSKKRKAAGGPPAEKTPKQVWTSWANTMVADLGKLKNEAEKLMNQYASKSASPLYSGKFQKVLNKIPEDINHKLTMLNKHRAQNTDVGDAVFGTKKFKDIETNYDALLEKHKDQDSDLNKAKR